MRKEGKLDVFCIVYSINFLFFMLSLLRQPLTFHILIPVEPNTLGAELCPVCTYVVGFQKLYWP